MFRTLTRWFTLTKRLSKNPQGRSAKLIDKTKPAQGLSEQRGRIAKYVAIYVPLLTAIGFIITWTPLRLQTFGKSLGDR